MFGSVRAMTLSAAPQITSPEQALKFYFGYDSFRPGQQEIVEAAIANEDLMVIMPTGGGKSLCYQLPALLKPGVTVVVSPLIALMQDQVQSLQDNGIGATFLNSTLRGDEVRSREADVLSGKTKLLYVAPERLAGDAFLGFLDRVKFTQGLATFAIDEAHCVSEWGHDFRPEYRQLRKLRQRYADVPMMALTATATQRVQEDILEQLELDEPFVHIASFNRANLYYDVRPKQRDAYAELLQLVKQTPGSGIIYCLSRKKVDELTSRLKQDGVEALAYHAGLGDQERSDNQTRFIRDDVRVMVATVAFGMGINKPDVRFVIHYDLPRNLESYYQESGRAGRDSEAATCTLFFSYGDLKTLDYLISQKVDPITGAPLEDEQRIARQQVRQVVDYAEGTDCRRKIQLAYFGESFPGNCGNCDNCLHPQPLVDWTIQAQKFLSCVARCKERFGMNHVIDVLRGSRNQKVLQHEHEKLSTHGIGKDHSAEEWRHLGRSLLHQGLVEETTDGYSILRLNAQSWQILRKERAVSIALPTQTGLASDQESRPTAEVEKLLRRLRTLRKAIADEQSVAPYIIFSDISLRQMAERQPQTPDEFSRISGVGSFKLEQYGDRFIGEIREFCGEHDIPLRSGSTAISSTPRPRSVSRTLLQTLELHEQGLAPAVIAEQRGCTLSTVYDHLEKLLLVGKPVDIDELVPEERQAKIVTAIETVGTASLRTLYDYLEEAFDYEEIRLVRAHWRNAKSSDG